jgi:hypothetical protein
MGTDRSPHETFMQAAGDGQGMAAAKLRQGMEQSATLHRCMLRYGHAFVVQTGHTAMANGRSKVEERLARWLLMAHDRLDGDELPLTHEFLAISIIDRKGLEEKSNGAYGVPEAEFRRLFA